MDSDGGRNQTIFIIIHNKLVLITKKCCIMKHFAKQKTTKASQLPTCRSNLIRFADPDFLRIPSTFIEDSDVRKVMISVTTRGTRRLSFFVRFLSDSNKFVSEAPKTLESI